MTFIAVVVAMVLFRSSTLGSALGLLEGMAGLNGVTLPRTIFDHLGPFAAGLQGLGVIADASSGQAFTALAMWIFAAMFIVLALPNTLQILDQYEPALGIKPQQVSANFFGKTFRWHVSFAWAIGMSVVVALGVTSLGGPSEFLYWQF